MGERRVYLDNSATTPVAEEVLKEMIPYFKEVMGNPNSLHTWGREARRAVDDARKSVAALVGADAGEIIFTGGGSASDNLAIKGSVWSAKGAKKHIITSAVEHHAVLDTCKWLGQNGCDVTILPTDKFGMIDPDSLANAIREDTLLVSVMHANNEVGTVNPIAKLGEICRNRGVIFHTDAVQSVGHMPVNLKELPVDMLTMSAHKMYGPKGVGALYIRKGLKLVPIIHGGGQEFGIYSGTENVPGIIGFGAAARLAVKLHEGGEEKRIALLRDKLINGVLGRIPDTVLTGHRAERLPFHASFCIRGADGSDILLEIDKAGIGGSSGSACTSGSTAPSYVLLAMGLDHGTAHGSVRLTLNKNTTEEDINYVLEKFPPIVKSLRSASRYGSDKMKRRS